MVRTELIGYWRTRLGSGIERMCSRKLLMVRTTAVCIFSYAIYLYWYLSQVSKAQGTPLWPIRHMPVCPLAGVSWGPGRIWSFQRPWGRESRFIGLNTSQQISFSQIRNLGAIREEMDAGDVHMEISI